MPEQQALNTLMHDHNSKSASNILPQVYSRNNIEPLAPLGTGFGAGHQSMMQMQFPTTSSGGTKQIAMYNKQSFY